MAQDELLISARVRGYNYHEAGKAKLTSLEESEVPKNFTPIAGHAKCDSCGETFAYGDTCHYASLNGKYRPQGRMYFIHTWCDETNGFKSSTDKRIVTLKKFGN